ncbi:MAG: hypothetical protein ACI96L_000470 [Paracoccaceae bacterium]|jgi:hypothetical protein
MKNKLHIMLSLAAISATVLSVAQTDSTQVKESKIQEIEIPKETIIEGKNMRLILKEKQVIEKNGEGKDTVAKHSFEIVTKDRKERNAHEDELLVAEGIDFIETSWSNFHLGLNNLLNRDGKLDPEPGPEYGEMIISPANSINFQWDIVTQAMNIYKGKVRLVYGIGIDYNNYRFQKNITLNPDSMPLMVTEDGINYDKNKLVTQHLNVPVMLNFKLSPKGTEDDVYISAGANFGYLIGSHQKQVWDDNGKKKNKVRDDYSLEQFRVGYEVQFGYKNIVLFGKYFSNSMFKANQGPELRTVSAGILIGKV